VTENRWEVRDVGREQTRVMIVDDHDSFRQPLAFMLEREPDLTVTAQASSLAEARELLKVGDGGGEVDVAVVDLDLPDGSGTEVLVELLDANPSAQALVLSAFSEPGRLAPAIEAGAAGVVHKSSPISDVVDVIRRLHLGEQLLSQREIIEAVRFIGRERRQHGETQHLIDKLTPREHEILQALAEGLGDKEIAERLYVSTGTVRTHITSILSKFGLRSRLQALVFALRHRLVRID
jgi:DNA-binding NarL/FixJ family response regulator